MEFDATTEGSNMADQSEHTDVLTAFDGDLQIDYDRTLSIRDPKWAHPKLRENWVQSLELYGFSTLYDPAATIEEKRKALSKVDFSIYYPPIEEGLVETQTFEAPGCPEEPDTPATVYVFTPTKLKGKKNLPVLFEIAGGGMLYCEPAASGLDRHALDYKCVVVGVKYRTSLEEPYPAAINDLHAGYAWMVEHADELGINVDDVVIYGGSSGGGLALSFPFRLMRYDYCGAPQLRGVVAGNPITDDREVYPCSEILAGFVDGVDEPKCFDAINYHTAYRMWLGYNYGSYRVGPEALANHATVEECIGYPPTMIFSAEFDPDRDYNREFAGKLYAAHTFCEYHCFSGCNHGGYFTDPDLAEIALMLQNTAMQLFWEKDVRRPWVVDDYKARFKKRFGE
jgi:acetyl esterase/lipase